MLIGRESECERLDELLDRARMGRSGALVLRGEPGIGKTVLLDYAAERAADMTVVRTLGVESEAELEFSALLDVCRPLLDGLGEIPEQQAEVLRGALGLGPPLALDRFAIGAATLGLLAAAAEELPLLVLVDDAQWVDQSSADALLFATRRLHADRAILLFAARDGDGRSFEAPGIETVSLEGLEQGDASRLLASQAEVSSSVADRLYAATGGNPLALVELPRLLSAGQLSGVDPLEELVPAGTGVEQAFARRAEALPDDTRRALLVAAVSISNAAEVIVDALASLGIDVRALEPAEDAGLLEVVNGKVEFRHPLVRSAVYHAAPPSERRAAHRAMADACRDSGPEERAWHLAAAAVGPDDGVAAALEQAAEEARRRSGFAAAATALERAARLTLEPEAKTRRLAAAANAAWLAGRSEAAEALVDETLVSVKDPELRATVLRLRGAIDYFRGRGDTASEALLEAIELLEGFDRDGAVAAAADAVNALVRIRKPELALETAQRGKLLAPQDGGETDVAATTALGYALCFNGRYAEAEPHLQRAVELAETTTTMSSPLEAVRLATALAWLGRFDDARELLSRAVDHARAVGAVGSLPLLLAGSGWQGLHAGRWNEAQADAGEAVELAGEFGHPATGVLALGILTWVHALRGDESACRSYGDETRGRADAHGFRLDGLLVSVCFGLLHLGAGRVDEAISELEEIASYAEERRLMIPGVAPQLELAEAYVRAGRVEDARDLVAAYERSELGAGPYLTVVSKRLQALLADEDEFASRFEDALSLHAAVSSPFALARTRLCYGERLRRAGRRVEAREHLRAALDVFESLGAAPWSERARSELRASGERLRRREAIEAEQLTPQELQIALQVAEGKTNKEVGAALFLSHKTVEFHLSRIYRKLDMSSRAELIRRFAESGERALVSS